MRHRIEGAARMQRTFRILMATFFVGSCAFLLAAVYVSSFWGIPFLLMPFAVGWKFRSIRCPSCNQHVAYMTVRLFGIEREMLRPFFPARCPHCTISLKQHEKSGQKPSP